MFSSSVLDKTFLRINGSKFAVPTGPEEVWTGGAWCLPLKPVTGYCMDFIKNAATNILLQYNCEKTKERDVSICCICWKGWNNQLTGCGFFPSVLERPLLGIDEDGLLDRLHAGDGATKGNDAFDFFFFLCDDEVELGTWSWEGWSPPLAIPGWKPLAFLFLHCLKNQLKLVKSYTLN